MQRKVIGKFSAPYNNFKMLIFFAALSQLCERLPKSGSVEVSLRPNRDEPDASSGHENLQKVSKSCHRIRKLTQKLPSHQKSFPKNCHLFNKINPKDQKRNPKIGTLSPN